MESITYDTLKISAPAPVLSWANHDLGIAELKMAQNVASLPFVFKHVALMPDVHLGKGVLVGSVIATKGAIIPAAIGVDIRCGMVAVKTSPYCRTTGWQVEKNPPRSRRSDSCRV